MGCWGRGLCWRPLEGSPDRGIRARLHAFRVPACLRACVPPLQPLSPCSLTRYCACNPKRGRGKKSKGRFVINHDASQHIASNRNTDDGLIAGLAARHTRKALATLQGRTGSQNSASRPSPAAQRHHLVDRPHASCWPQVDFRLPATTSSLPLPLQSALLWLALHVLTTVLAAVICRPAQTSDPSRQSHHARNLGLLLPLDHIVTASGPVFTTPSCP